MAKTNRDYARERSARGLCCSCGEQAIPGTSRCERHTQLAKDRYRATYVKTRKPASAKGNFDPVAWSKARYDTRKAQGVCVDCAAEPALPDSVYGQICLDKQRATQRAKAEAKQQNKRESRTQEIAARRAAGLCVDCCDQDLFSKLRCDRCYANWLQTKHDWSRHAARRHVGLCGSCDAKSSTGETRCSACRLLRQQAATESVKQGRCGRCNEVNASAPQYKYCQPCREKTTAKIKAHELQGLCGCGKQAPLPNKKHCQICRDKGREKALRRVRALRAEILVAYGNECRCCGDRRPEFIHLDHVNNDGAAHRRSLRKDGLNHSGGNKVYRDVKRRGFPQNEYQLLCSNCNGAKARYECCPHQLLPPKLLAELRDLNSRIATALANVSPVLRGRAAVPCPT